MNKHEDENAKIVESLLLASFNGANVSYGKCPLGGQKFRIDLAAQKMFLSISQEYLSDQRETRIRADFELYSVGQTLLMNPGRYFLLGNSGVQEIQAQDIAS